MNAPIFPSTPEQILLVPVDQLVASDLNVRKTGGQSISELAASIRAHGLLQNLTAVATKSTSRGKVVDKFHVVAGGRRLRAIQQLIEEGHLPADYQVPVRIVGKDDAVAASLAENTVREAMNPADQVLAFKAMADEDMSPAEIADAFGVSEVTVQRRLALANVAPHLDDAQFGRLVVWAAMNGLEPMLAKRHAFAGLVGTSSDYTQAHDSTEAGIMAATVVAIARALGWEGGA